MTPQQVKEAFFMRDCQMRLAVYCEASMVTDSLEPAYFNLLALENQNLMAKVQAHQSVPIILKVN